VNDFVQTAPDYATRNVAERGARGRIDLPNAPFRIDQIDPERRLVEQSLELGIYFQPNTNAQLYISDSIITGNSGTGPLSGGIVITPSASASVNAFISRVKVEGNSTGIIVDGKRSTMAAVNVTVLDSMVVGSTKDGILAQTSAGKARVSVFIDHSVVSGNLESGVKADGPAGLAGSPPQCERPDQRLHHYAQRHGYERQRQ
jgi:hypothetical protein